MKRLTAQFERLTRWLHYLSGALLVGLMMLTVVNILGRWLFNTPVPGTVELTEIGMVGIVFMGLAYAQVREDHIKVDLLYEQLGARGRRVLGLFAALVSFATVAVLTWRLWAYASRLQASGRTTSALQIPLSWVAWAAVIGGAIYAVGVLVTVGSRAQLPEGDVAGTVRRTSDDTSRGGTAGDAT
jgi:TRAP-type C4-dicarboxylate transport system permease small subunit